VSLANYATIGRFSILKYLYRLFSKQSSFIISFYSPLFAAIFITFTASFDSHMLKTLELIEAGS